MGNNNIIEFVGEIHEENIDLMKKKEIEHSFSKNFSGDGTIITIICTITPLIMPFLTKIIITSIRSNEKKSFKIDGDNIDITGMSSSEVINILQRFYDQKNINKEDKA